MGPSRPFTPVEPAARPPGAPRGVTGDVRALNSQQTAQIIDATWDEPKVLLVTGQSSGGVSLYWTLRAGVERATLGTFEYESTNFSRVVIARSIQLSVQNQSLINGVQASAVVVVIDASAEITDILGTSPHAPEGKPNVALFASYAISTAAISLTSSIPTNAPFGVGYYAGMTIYNRSPGGRNMFILLGDANPIVNDTFTHIIAPGGMYEVPYGYNGDVRAIWDGVDAAGAAAVTVLGFQG